MSILVILLLIVLGVSIRTRHRAVEGMGPLPPRPLDTGPKPPEPAPQACGVTQLWDTYGGPRACNYSPYY